ncbi:LmeA family phospholipid-binding protein [Streptomyces sp. NBC_00080]|uniref:hypothetical protein n=1 Tax=Streptomyces sp. NBC_00080 TaxID=2975645 RepID=UPI00325237A8
MSRRDKMRTAVVAHPVLTLMVVVVLLALLTAAAELAARKIVKDQIRSESVVAGSGSTVYLRGGWGLTALAGHEVPRVDILTDHATLGPFADVPLQMEIFGLRMGTSPSFDRVHGLAVVGADDLVEALSKEAPGMGVTSVKMNSFEGTITLAVGGGTKMVTLEPQLDRTSGQVVFKPADGVQAGAGNLLGLGKLMSGEGDGPAATLGLRIQAVAVARNGLHLVLDAPGGKLNP